MLKKLLILISSIIISSIIISLILIPSIILVPDFVSAGGVDIWLSCCDSECDYSPGEEVEFGGSTYCCKSTGWTPGSCCSDLNYPSDRWQRVWYVHSTGACLGDGPDEAAITFDTDWSTGVIEYSRSDDIEFNSSRTISIPTTGTYTFTLGSDDGSMLWIDGIEKINRWYNTGYDTTSTDVYLTAGNHQFRIDYYEDPGSARVSFSYTAPTTTTTLPTTTTTTTTTTTLPTTTTTTTTIPGEEPDLIITDISSSGSEILYRIDNVGGGSTEYYSYSHLYVDGSYKAPDYVDALAAGAFRWESFSTYTWTCSGTSDTIMVRADGTNRIIESDETNNDKTEIWDCPSTTTTTTTTLPGPCSYSPGPSDLVPGDNTIDFQTPHDYTNDLSCWSEVYSCPDGYKAKVYVDYVTESCCDFFYIYNDQDYTYDMWSGDSGGHVWVEHPDTRKVQFRFWSDSSLVYWGVDVDIINCYTDAACDDSDGGNYPLTAGICTDSTDHQDSCSGSSLTEYYCSGTSCTSTTKNCEDYETLYCDGASGDIYRNEWRCSASPGYCNDGATDTLIDDCVNTCTETDGGEDYPTKGTVTDKNLCSAGQTSCPTDIVKPDECLSSSTLREYYCSGNDYTYTDKNCGDYGAGWTCNLGKCEYTASCSDSDAGDNPLTAGTCTDTGGDNQDSCSGSELTEYYCAGTSCTTPVTPYECNDYDCTTGLASSCTGAGTSTLTRDGDDYICSDSNPDYCAISGSKNCAGISSCGPPMECQPASCAGTGYTCHWSNSGAWAWDTFIGPETACDDGFDNDCDGGVDCDDTNGDCDLDPACIVPCELTSASVTANCAGGSSTYCEQGESITMSGTYTGDCSAADFFQIDAISADLTCDIQYSGGDMSGIWDSTITVAGGSVSGSWVIPAIASDCSGKTVSATYASVKNGGGTGTVVDDTWDVSGSFTFYTPCTCDDWANDACGAGTCLDTQMRQTRTCTPVGCEPILSQCVGPEYLGSWIDQGCAADCETAGTCAGNKQCQKRIDSYGCKDAYRCELDPNCKVTTFNIYRGWNLISSPIANIESITEDTCGATNANFYYYNVETSKWVVDTVGILNLQKGIGYWFYSSKSCTVTIGGSGDVTSNDITIYSGWNQVGSPTGGMSSAAVDLMKNTCMNCGSGGTAGSCSTMKTLWYDPVAQSWKEVSSLEDRKGYHIQCTS